MLIAYVVGMFVWSNAEASRHICKGIEVQIDGKNKVSYVTEQNVKDILKDYPKMIEGQPLPAVNTYDIAEYLRKFNSFETVECMITTKGNLKVKVTPMIPAIRVFDNSSVSYYVNKDGKTMAALPSFHVDVPVVSGRFNDKLKPDIVLPVVRFIEKDSLLSNVVGMIQVKGKEDIILIPRIKGHVINIGDTTRLQEKRNAILTAYRSILPYKGWETYDTISVKFRGQIVATRRDKTPLFPLPVIDDMDDGEEASLQASVDGDQSDSTVPNNTNNQENNPQ